jgi:hypothetical protein
MNVSATEPLQGAPEFLREFEVLARQRLSTLLLNGELLTVLLATSVDAITHAGTTMERHPVQSAERAPAAEQPSGVVYGRQRVALTVKGK